jgi:hypothetical protein
MNGEILGWFRAGGFRFFPTLEAAQEAAKTEPKLWKLTFVDQGEHVSHVRKDDGTWEEENLSC